MPSMIASIIGLIVAAFMLAAGGALMLAMFHMWVLLRRYRIARPSIMLLLAWLLVLVSLLTRTACDTALWAIKQSSPLVMGVER